MLPSGTDIGRFAAIGGAVPHSRAPENDKKPTICPPVEARNDGRSANSTGTYSGRTIALDEIRVLVRLDRPRGKEEERELVARLIGRLQLDDEEKECVCRWLEAPPPPDSVDPGLVPKEHRMTFLRAVESMVSVDGEVSPEERDTLVVFAQLIR